MCGGGVVVVPTEQSRPRESIVREVEELVRNGYREVRRCALDR